MSWGIFLSFLFLAMSLNAMDRVGRDDQRGCTDRVASWTGRMFGRAMKSAVKEVDFGELLAEDVIRKPLEEVKIHVNTTMKSATRKALKEFDEQFDATLKKINKDFFKKIVIENFRKIIFYTSIGIACNICVWYGAKILTSYINDRFKKPKVIIRSSQKNLLQKLKDFVVGEQKKEPIKMIFSPHLEDRLSQFVQATRHTREHIQKGKKGVKYRNLLLYGPPGTGKTTFARKLCEESGLEFVEVTGSSFSQKGAGIKALAELFDWAEKSSGLCMFIDEVESLIPPRKDLDQGGEKHSLANYFLNRSGQRSDKFMLIMATNHSDRLDNTMNRRTDDKMELTLPEKKERYDSLKDYRQTILFHKDNEQDFIKSVQQYLSDKKLQKIAEEIEGHSYADIEGIINKIRTDAFTTKDGLLNSTLVDKVVAEFKKEHEAFKQKSPNKKSKNNSTDLLEQLKNKKHGGDKKGL